MSPRKNIEFAAFPHEPEVVDKVAWRSDMKFDVPYEAFPISFPTARFTDSLLKDAQTGVRFAQTDYVPESGLLVTRFIFDAESREAALQHAVCVTFAALASIERADPREMLFEQFNLGYLFDQREFGIEPANVIRELPEVIKTEIPHHPLAA